VRLIDLLPQEHVAVPVEGSTVHDAVRALLGRLGASGAIADPDGAARALLGPRAREIVAAGPDVVLPHLRTDAVDSLIVALGVAATPLAAVRPDGATPRIVTLILAPPRAATLYLQTVAAFASLFRKESVIERLLEAKSGEEVRALPQLAALRIESRLTVRDLMVHRPDGIGADAPVREAVDAMVRRRLRAMPVVGGKGEVLGIISEWEVMRAMLPQIPRASDSGAEPAEAQPLRVRDIMTRSVLCISEDLGLEEAARMMINKDVEQFPVTSEGKLTGFLTRGDIIRKLFGR
jgi:CBS domain-containing protein/mannitol/fructose-specific phosphotransferase system IIA component (Ntr-type)